jgi:hypothetical protein
MYRVGTESDFDAIATVCDLKIGKTICSKRKYRNTVFVRRKICDDISAPFVVRFYSDKSPAIAAA